MSNNELKRCGTCEAYKDWTREGGFGGAGMKRCSLHLRALGGDI